MPLTPVVFAGRFTLMEFLIHPSGVEIPEFAIIEIKTTQHSVYFIRTLRRPPASVELGKHGSAQRILR
jgi:hypothetical protein